MHSITLRNRMSLAAKKWTMAETDNVFPIESYQKLQADSFQRWNLETITYLKPMANLQTFWGLLYDIS